MKRFLKQIIGELSLKTLLVSFLFLFAIFAFGWLAHAVFRQNDTEFDDNAFAFFHSINTPALISVMKTITFFGSTWFLISGYIIIIIVLYFIHRRTDALNVAIVAITSNLLMFGLKEFFKRQRPELPLLEELTNYSFPSGHATSSFIFFSVMVYLISKSKIGIKWKWIFGTLFILFSVTIGISRIVLRYHYVTDVLAGFCIGTAWVIFSLWLERKLTSRKVERQLDTVQETPVVLSDRDGHV